ncbi:MAG: sensor histidine kinase [Congregibacter sp.]
MRRVFESRTLLQLILLGFLAVMLPLAVAIIVAIVQSENLANATRGAMVLVQTSTDTSRQLAGRVRDLERSARQYIALNDPEFLSLYRERRREVRALLAVLANVSSSVAITPTLEEVTAAEELLHTAVEYAADENELDEAFGRLRESASELLSVYSLRGQELARQVPERAADLRTLLVLLAAMVIPLSLALAAIFLALASRPLRQLNSGIRALGRGSLQSPIEIHGARDLVELGERLDWLRTRLIALEEQKTLFLRNVSHELKTPLTNIREASVLLLDGPQALDPVEVSTVTRILHDNGLRLQALIEELLRFGAAENSYSQSWSERVDMQQLVAETVHKQSIAARAREIRLRTQLAAVELDGNARQLEIIVDNLLSNAIKFTVPGGEIRISLARHDADVHVDVCDDGPGVASEHKHDIFEWFFRGSPDTDTLVAGTGMGLAIACEYARQHGGSLELLPSSRGAHFRLCIAVGGGEE